MTQFKEPVFTREELAEINKNISIGYNGGELLAGYDFAHKPFTKGFGKAKEKLNGTAKKREYHEKINSFGWARFDQGKEPALTFGIKFNAWNGGLTKLGKNAIEKYKQLLGYYLERVGWQGITINDFGDYNVPMNNPTNIKLLYTLSPSIGFYYKSGRPDMADLEEMEYMTESKKLNQERKISGRSR